MKQNLKTSSYRLLFIFFLIFLFTHISAHESEKYEIKLPNIIVTNVSAEICISPTKTSDFSILTNSVDVKIDGVSKEFKIKDGRITFLHTFKSESNIAASIGNENIEKKVKPIPLWFSILPPLIAIIIALIFKEVFSALLIGIFFGSFIINYYQGNTFFEALIYGFFNIITDYILEALNNPDHLSIIVFSILIGGMVTLITKNGGMKGIVNILARYSTGPTSGQFVAWLLGIVIFFDDYANTLVVGNTMRPITDKLRISREKLSYIVDSTAAPITAIAMVTTWIGAELGYIQDSISYLNLEASAYNVFLHSLKYSFYPVLALLFILIIILKKRDFGPMHKAEIKARMNFEILKESSKENIIKNQKSQKWYNAVIPIVVIIFGVIIGLIRTGLEHTNWDSESGLIQNISNILGYANSYKALLWASFASVFTALVLTISQKILSLKESMESIIAGFKTMITAIVILVLAWSIALMTNELHTADFFSNLLLNIQISPFLVPALTFILASFISFSTGSSWGTMAILYPLILPSSWLISIQFGLSEDQSMVIFYNVVSAVLSGSVLGDHCSPISDTTILSSLASSCNHIDHVRTQLPYALTVGVIALLIGTIPSAYGIPSYILFPIALISLYLIVIIFGKRTDEIKT